MCGGAPGPPPLVYVGHQKPGYIFLKTPPRKKDLESLTAQGDQGADTRGLHCAKRFARYS